MRADGSPVAIVEEHGGFAFGGNKIRQLDLILGQALADGHDTLIAAAGSHSNLCRVLSAAGSQLGLDVHLLLRGGPDEIPRGNQLLYNLCGVDVRWLDIEDPFDPKQTQATYDLADELTTAGRKPLVVDVRLEHSFLGALAATGLLDELDEQLEAPPTHAVVATGGGQTAAGILAGLVSRGWPTRLISVSVNVEAGRLAARIEDLTRQLLEAAEIEQPDQLPFEVTDRFVGPGYGIPTPEGVRAIHRTAELSGLFLDPTYTGKAMAALLNHPEPGEYLFVHTGGSPTVFQQPLPLEK